MRRWKREVRGEYRRSSFWKPIPLLTDLGVYSTRDLVAYIHRRRQKNAALPAAAGVGAETKRHVEETPLNGPRAVHIAAQGSLAARAKTAGGTRLPSALVPASGLVDPTLGDPARGPAWERVDFRQAWHLCNG